MRLVLFDIDGTLLLTHGAGMRAFNRAFEVKHVLPDAVKAVQPDGKTDPQIVREILKICGREPECTNEMLTGFFSSYLSFLKEEMAVCTQLRIMPGVRELLARLVGEPDFCVGLATGNIEEGAWLKLRYARLHSFFHFGGFGSDSEDRTEVVRQGIARGTALVAPRSVEAAFVVGDTPRDIIHAKAAAARTIAVATGTYSLDTLQQHEPDLAVRTLEEIEPVMEVLKS